MGDGDNDGCDREMGDGDWDRAEGGLRAEAESSENLWTERDRERETLVQAEIRTQRDKRHAQRDTWSKKSNMFALFFLSSSFESEKCGSVSVTCVCF